jgi:GTP-binding protein Era
MVHSPDYRCGYVTITGRPNVGKSSLLNRVLGQKISITSRKPQTTRWHLLGIKSDQESQIIYVDTPGLQKSSKNAITRHMNREVTNSIAYVDVLIFMIDIMIWNELDEYVLDQISNKSIPVVLVLNKVDKIKDKQALLPFMDEISSKMAFAEVIPISATKGNNIEQLECTIRNLLPVAPPLFPDDQLTDRNERFFAAEFIREKLTQKLGGEVPYRISVTIEQFKHKGKVLHINATIWVERRGQKIIVIGEKGKILKSVGEQARKDMEAMFGSKVYLQTWVKVKKKWADNEQALKQLGYEN